MKLKVVLKGDAKNVKGGVRYHTEINALNYKDLSLVFKDLENSGLPIKKAIKEFNLEKSFWDLTLGG